MMLIQLSRPTQDCATLSMGDLNHKVLALHHSSRIVHGLRSFNHDDQRHALIAAVRVRSAGKKPYSAAQLL